MTTALIRSRPAGLAAALVLALLGGAAVPGRAAGDRWTEAERATLASMRLSQLPPAPSDPSNAVESRPEAVALGRRLFFDTRLSANGAVACATCHDPEKRFQDGRPVGQGVGTGQRRTMPIAGAAHSPWLFWDGRKDSLWSQALGPLEDAAEHGATRVFLVRRVASHHRVAYEAVFGPLPSLAGLPAEAGPLGNAAQREAWARLSDAQRDAVNRVFAGIGKSIAAFERTVQPRPARFDRYVEAVLRGDEAGQGVLAPAEVRGLRVFLGPGQCATCHNGPLLSDQHFHNTGVPPRDPARPDPGRAAAVGPVQQDEFNCLGRHSDAPPDACQELRFIATGDPGMQGAFKTPSLRHVAERAPYMHAGQLATLEAVVDHYQRSPPAVLGHSELAHRGGGHAERRPIRLRPAEAADLVAFLRTLGEAGD